MSNDVSPAIAILQQIKKCRISYVIILPSNGPSQFMDVVAREPSLTLVPVCREGETFAIGAGLYVGGKESVIVIQNTGFFESGDSIRGINLGYGVPQLVLMDYRGWERNSPLTDTAAIYTEPMLDTWGIRYYLVTEAADIDKISVAYQETQASNQPVFVLIGGMQW